LFKAFFADGSKWGVKIDYSLEDKPLSTMGPLRLINDLPDNFLVMNGDILTDLNFSSFYDEHVNRQNKFTISSHSREHRIDYGVLDVDDNRYLAGFREKPVYQFEVSMGIYMVSSAAIRHIPQDKVYGFDNLMRDMLAAGEKVAVRAYKGLWLDIGRPDDYMQAIEQFEKMKSRFLSD
jgi:NDP-sugar pyrophosphorylase family protein